ncbi:MAG: hypothetical protein AAGF81_19010 [Pseudomonadota bacterium]
MRTLASLALAFALILGGFFSIFNVPDGSQALIFRGSEIHRKVGPGLQARIPVIERIKIEPLPNAQ